MRRLWSGSAKKGDSIDLPNLKMNSLIAVETSGQYLLGRLGSTLHLGSFYSGIDERSTPYVQAYVMDGVITDKKLKINSCFWTVLNDNTVEHQLTISAIYELFGPAK